MVEHVRVFAAGRSGHPPEFIEDLELTECGGVVPTVGDTIVCATIAGHLDRSAFHEPQHRRVWMVLHRYIMPNLSNPRIALVVSERPAKNEERDFL